MNELVSLLMILLLQTNPCHVPDIEMTCEEYRIRKQPVQLCTGYYKGTDYELVIDEDHVLELWESYDRGMRPSFKRYTANGIWKNIYKGAITGKPSKPDYCGIKELNPNRHNK